jgi:general secretion pathway protein N
MRLDDIAPRTLLIGAFAGWAAVAWVLALAGMGGRLPEGRGGPITGNPLPTLPKAATAPSLGPYAQYGEISARPLFATDRRPHAFSLAAPNAAGADTPPDFDLVLTSVLITPQARLAIVQKPDGSEAWRVRVGEAPDSQPDWHLVELQPRSAVFEGPGGRKELALRVFDGKGGPASDAPPAAVPPAPPMAGSPMPVPKSTPTTTTTPPPATDAASVPDPAQIEQIRQRIEARREEMRRRAANANPPATVASPTPPANR